MTPMPTQRQLRAVAQLSEQSSKPRHSAQPITFDYARARARARSAHVYNECVAETACLPSRLPWPESRPAQCPRGRQPRRPLPLRYLIQGRRPLRLRPTLWGHVWIGEERAAQAEAAASAPRRADLQARARPGGWAGCCSALGPW